MKFVLLLFVVAASAFVAQKRVISPELEQLTGSELVDYVNQHQTLWKAKLSSTFNTLTMEERKRRMGVKSIEVPAEYRMKEVTHREIPDDQIPSTFDAQTQWPNCQLISHIRDQSACGSCWAMSSAEVMSDRLCIFSNGQIQVQISAVDILSCCGLICNENCIGGYPIEAFKNWISKGYVTGGDYNSGEGCKPYPWAECEHHYHNETHYKNCPLIPTHLEPKCVHECEAGYSKSYNDDLYFGQSAYAVSKQVADIQKELMTNGPIVLAYNIYEDFEHYTGGIYIHTAGSYMGGHAVKLVGWGTENGTPFWRIANSWNADWGENGYFRILRGVDECGIESGAVAGLPKI